MDPAPARTAKQCSARRGYLDVEFSSSKRQLPESASSFTLSPTRERLYRPRTPHVSVLPSSAEPPFSPENDDQLLELYRLKGPACKTISRAVEPQRHKKEVNGRLDYLLQPYDFATFFPSDV
ncbi:hypothetical protein BCR35DRAFT_316498 [Leucosporidium creatinivorum]|uniref:Uncharacterized protein n=1 Tax=Leucosporidium creatinivorum TaxID=106004 RepID=A0A1Y2BZ85_9BASI|nr:hypothetical protein BCR35DRAFT_316498 [Leucosporidium creatinivorum]